MTVWKYSKTLTLVFKLSPGKDVFLMRGVTTVLLNSLGKEPSTIDLLTHFVTDSSTSMHSLERNFDIRSNQQHCMGGLVSF